MCLEESISVCLDEEVIWTHALSVFVCGGAMLEHVSMSTSEKKCVCVGEKVLIYVWYVLCTWDSLLSVLFASLCMCNFFMSADCVDVCVICLNRGVKLTSQSSAGAEDVKIGSVQRVEWCDKMKRENYAYLHLCHLAEKKMKRTKEQKES